MVVKVRTSGTVINRPAYVVVGVDVDGRKHVLGVGSATAVKAPNTGVGTYRDTQPRPRKDA